MQDSCMKGWNLCRSSIFFLFCFLKSSFSVIPRLKGGMEFLLREAGAVQQSGQEMPGQGEQGVFCK